MRRLDLHTGAREQLVDITTRVQEIVRESGVVEGWVLVFCPHTTAGITINEHADPAVTIDVLDGLARLVPHEASWQHAEGNSDAHIKSSLIGCSELVPVSRGQLAVGTWQGVYLCEFDGPRHRTVYVTVSEE